MTENARSSGTPVRRSRRERHLIALLQPLADVTGWLLFVVLYFDMWPWTYEWRLVAFLVYAALVALLRWYRAVRRDPQLDAAARRRWWLRAAVLTAAGAVVVTLVSFYTSFYAAYYGYPSSFVPLWVFLVTAPVFALAIALHLRGAVSTRIAHASFLASLLLFVAFSTPLWWSAAAASLALSAAIVLPVRAKRPRRSGVHLPAVATATAASAAWALCCSFWLYEQSTTRLERDPTTRLLPPEGLPAWAYATGGAALAAAAVGMLLLRRLAPAYPGRRPTASLS